MRKAQSIDGAGAWDRSITAIQHGRAGTASARRSRLAAQSGRPATAPASIPHSGDADTRDSPFSCSCRTDQPGRRGERHRICVFADLTAAVEVLPRPLFVVAIVTLAFQVVLSLFLGDRDKGAFVTVLLVAALIGQRQLLAILLVVPLAMAVAALLFRRSLPTIPWARFIEALNIIVVLTLGMSVLGNWNSGVFESRAGEHRPTAAFGTGPDVYIILLDGYPRSDTLQEEFGFDNSHFLDEMELIGFEVAPLAHSNDNATILTLASMLNMRQISRHPRTRDSSYEPPRTIPSTRGIDQHGDGPERVPGPRI